MPSVELDERTSVLPDGHPVFYRGACSVTRGHDGSWRVYRRGRWGILRTAAHHRPGDRVLGAAVSDTGVTIVLAPPTAATSPATS